MHLEGRFRVPAQDVPEPLVRESDRRRLGWIPAGYPPAGRFSALLKLAT